MEENQEMQETTHMRTHSRGPNTRKIPTISFGNLPPELIQEILLKLDTKSLLKSTLVCKSWNSLVKSPYFISTDLERSLSASKNSEDNDPLLHIRCAVDGYVYYALPSEEERRLLFPSCDWVSGSCNGLVCLRVVCDDAIILFNPLIKKWLSLPKLEWRFEELNSFILVGLGFNIRTNDYKVLRIAKARIGQFSVGPVVNVYSLKSNSWKSVDSAFASGYLYDWTSQVCFAFGCLHYVAEPVVNGSRKVIVGFDVGDEVFREILLPESLESLGRNSLDVVAYGGGSSIAVVKYLLHNSYSCCNRCEVWVMRVYGIVESWTKLLSVRDPAYCLGVLGFKKNGEVLVERMDHGVFHHSDGEADNEVVVLHGYGISLVSCDPKSKEFKHVWDLNYDGRSYVNSYVGSLALLDIGIPIDDQLTTDSDASCPNQHREA